MTERVMSKKEVTYPVQADGTLAYGITGKEPAAEIFRTLWESATEFGMVTGVPVIYDYSGKEKRKQFKLAFDEFPGLLDAMTRALWVNSWPGTGPGETHRPRTEPSVYDRLLVLGKTKKVDFEEFFAGNSTLFWEGPGGWDDLMLFSKGKLIFYVCTHESFGGIFGDADRFGRLKLSGARPNDKLWESVIRGFEIDKNFVEDLVRS